MGRRKKTIFYELIELPWWVNAVAAGIIYFGLKYWLPWCEFEDPFLKPLTKMLSPMAPIFAGILLVATTLSAIDDWRKRRLLNRQRGLNTIQEMSWQAFEEMVGEAFRREGYAVSETGGGGADGGVDLILKKGGSTQLVQCKQWKQRKVGVKVLRELYGVVAAEHAGGGIVVTTGEFTAEAVRFASGKPLELIDGQRLAKLVEALQQGTRVAMQHGAKTESDNKSPAEAPTCPKCGMAMIRRQARRGAKAGSVFWGCTAFPRCRGTRAISE